MRLLNCVISYNRFYYLRNTVESMRHFWRVGDSVIIDNGSTDGRIHAYLDAVAGSNVRVIRREAGGQTDRPGLNDAMNDAVMLARKGGYSHINFVQDDMQFMWLNPGAATAIERIFEAREDAIQVSSLFFNKIDWNAASNVDVIDSVGAYRHRTLSLRPIGIVPVRLLENSGFRFSEETRNSNYWWSLGFRVYFLRDPVLAWIPWPAAYRYGRRYQTMLPPVRDYYLKPLDAQGIAKLTTRPIGSLPVHEDYCAPWNWAALSPYWFFLRNDRDYAGRILASGLRGRILVPRWRMNGWPRYFAPGCWACLGVVRGAILTFLDRSLQRLRFGRAKGTS